MRRILILILVLVFIFSFVPKGFTQTSEEEIAALKQQVRDMMKRIEQLEAEQIKAKKEVKKEEEKPPVAKAAEGLVPGYAKEGQLKFKGYVQTRYEYFQNDSGEDRFRLKSAYIIPYGYVVPNWGFEFEIDAADTTGKVLRNAYIEYLGWKPYAIFRVGQQKPSYSEEFWTSSSTIDTIERAQAVSNLSAERDIGLNLLGKLFNEKLEYGIGIFNGSGINANDNNDNKDVAGRIVLSPFKGTGGLFDEFRFGGGAWIGKQSRSGTNVDDRTRYTGMASYKYKRLKLQGEYLFQEFDQTTGKDKESDGWYAMGIFDVIGGYPLLQLVGKYEQYDPNIHLSGDRQDIITAGANYFFNKYTKIMANYRFLDEQNDEVGNDEFLTQLQVKF